MKSVASASASGPVSQLRSSFLSCPSKPSSAFSQTRKSLTFHRPPSSYPCVRAVELDQSTIVAISVGVVSIAVGIGIPVFYETQIDNAAKRDNSQPCFPCNGSGAQKCRFCTGSGSVTVELGGGEQEVSGCINCNGAGSLTCSTCQGSGIQPRYLDRRCLFYFFDSFLLDRELLFNIGPTVFPKSYCAVGNVVRNKRKIETNMNQ
ncbi:hypothetical protein F511_14176 [Dorcoceras hygrometricum]|uniref:Protein SPA, chloroplastic n=1 Tax=Dorcoceras hygrometricum TaxID=472368 RepID=A0A2Z7BZ04_9LAMI|nr:hypothetical protein F511_14176 [Dorcoceras hygrometricum]